MNGIKKIFNGVHSFLMNDTNFKHIRNAMLLSIVIGTLSLASLTLFGISNAQVASVLFITIAGFGTIACVTSILFSIMYTLRTDKKQKVRRRR